MDPSAEEGQGPPRRGRNGVNLPEASPIAIWTARRVYCAQTPTTLHDCISPTHWAPFAALPIGTITRPDVAARLQTLVKERGKVAAARARANLSALFSWAMREGLVDANPTIATNRPDLGTRPRERVL